MEVKQSATDHFELVTTPEIPVLPLDAPPALPPIADIFSARLAKSWARALQIPPEAVEALRTSPAFEHLEPFFAIGRDLKLVGGAVEFAVDDSGRFVRYVLSDWADYLDANRTRERLVESLVGSIPQESLSSAFFDYDRIPRDHSRFSEVHLRREVLRAIRDELFPTTVSAMLGHLGSPLGRGEAGFDISCIRSKSAQQDQIIEQVQVKILRDDSPILNLHSLKGLRQFWKLVTTLREPANERTMPKALILEQNVSDEKVAQLESRLVAEGIDPGQIIVLGEADLRACGFQIKEVRSDDGNLYPLRIRVELQAFMRACCATEFLGRNSSIFKTPDVDALAAALHDSFGAETARTMAESVASRGPLEYQLLLSYGVWPLKLLLETSRIFPKQSAA